VFEIAAHGRPAILIPYPHATGDHQTTNAEWMASAGAAVVLADDELMPMRLRETVYALLDDPDRLAEMREASSSLARPAAARAVAAQVLAAADGSADG
jgi:UDP-N-acetylglucosamine--N-acetylmuramyl-(pentapeptide) pyrophosphoryl-undecaprenol N-acetylglucosamine transferase